jgi:RHH-type proline utilization regulon transcriptional repressor/proline dehydrogenase/delta 1-pyrroline-5-carboxylate dehydrogenase
MPRKPTGSTLARPARGALLRSALAGWNGIGFVVQAYQKRCPRDRLARRLARRTRRRLMVRLVKGAYWDSEIKRAQVDGLDGYPVFTRKVHTDVSYLACARAAAGAPDAVFPQFATHNAHTLARPSTMAGGELLRRPVRVPVPARHGRAAVRGGRRRRQARRPCRIYAPVGTHETLLAYLVRRLLENGANTSFVNRIATRLVEDPVDSARAITPLGAPHPKIALPRRTLRRGTPQFRRTRPQQNSSSPRSPPESAPVSAMRNSPRRWWPRAPVPRSGASGAGARRSCAIQPTGTISWARS